MKNPNILFIQVDQMAARMLRAYGDPICHAPAIDRLADTGVVFERAYCNFALCAPSRSSMATGQLCSAIGAYDNAAAFSSEIPTYAHYLRNLGYQTSLSGKMHYIGPDQYHGFEQRLTPDLYPADFSWVPNWGDEGERDTNDPRSVTISGVCERSVQIDFDNEVTDKAVQHLYDMVRSNDSRPFFMQVSYTHPHEPYLCRQAYWDLYDHDQVPQPTVGPLSESGHDAHSVRLLKDFGMFDVAFAEQDVQRARHAYYGSISYLDSQIERLLATLEGAGLRDKTAIVFTSDHGDFLGERGMWFKKHFYEPSLRVPLIIQAPWIKPGRVAELVSLVDLLPTFNGLALGEPWQPEAEELAGLDLMTLLDNGDSSSNRTIYAEYLAEATTAPIFMIRRGEYKFVFSENDPPLLFNLTADSDERNNLADKHEYAELVRAFTAEVSEKWDARALARDIRLSQKHRGLIRSANAHGQQVRWNHGETAGEKVRWYRGEEGYNEWAFNYLPVQ